MRERSTPERTTPARPQALETWLSEPGQRLTVLGEGGTGKTMLAIRSAAEIASRAAGDPAAPLAVYARLNFFTAQTNAFSELITVVARAMQ